MYAKYKCYARPHHQILSIQQKSSDFNYKNIDWDKQFATNGNRHLADFIDTLQECFPFQHVTEPARHRVNEASDILDLVLSSEEG